MASFFGWLTSWDGLAFILMMAAYACFVRDIRKPGSETKINISTWVAWGLMDILLFFALVKTGLMPWTVPAYVIGVAAVVGAAIHKGATFKPGWMDYFCMGVVLVASVWWLYFGGLEAAVVCVSLGCSIATVPMFVHLWKDPRGNSLDAWILGFLGGGCALLAVVEWTIVGSMIQITFFIVPSVILLTLLRRFLPKRSGEPISFIIRACGAIFVIGAAVTYALSALKQKSLFKVTK